MALGLLDRILIFLETYAEELAATAALLVIVTAVWVAARKRFSKARPAELGEATLDKLSPDRSAQGLKLTTAEFIRIRHALKEELQAELETAAQQDRAQLMARIAESENQIANPEQALEDAKARIAEFETLLKRESNEIGADHIAEAIAALETADYSKADALFAEIEARAAPAGAARAAYGRGEVAEAEIRWQDAATHYARAAELDPNFDRLLKAREFAWRTGALARAFRFGEDLIATARTEEAPGRQVQVFNEHATTLKAQGRYAEAEALYREVLAIDKVTIGTKHPDYASHLNNLATAVRAQGRYAEAEGLLRKALGIGKATFGDGHPHYALSLNNLANAVWAQGRSAEAEALLREAVAILEATLPADHPNTLVVRENLAAFSGKAKDRADR